MVKKMSTLSQAICIEMCGRWYDIAMEIRRSPEVARPAPEKKTRKVPVWLWVGLVILVVAGLVVGALFVFGVFGKSDGGTNSEADSLNQSSGDSEDLFKGIAVEATPDADQLTSLIYGRQFDQSKDKDAEKPYRFSVTSVDTDKPGNAEDDSNGALAALDEETLFELNGSTKEIPLNAWVAPNGQLLAVLQDRNYEKKQGDDDEQTLYVTTIDGRARHNIAEGVLNTIGTPVWTDDSRHIIFSTAEIDGDGTDAQVVNTLEVFDVNEGTSSSFERPQEDEDGRVLSLVVVRGDDLFVIRSQDGVEDPGELGVISLGANAEADGAFEKLLDLSAAGRGFSISHDGKSIVVARGTGESLGSDEKGPYMIELLDRATGELTELRESATEKYSSPLFSNDDKSIVYGAISGLWRLDIKSKARTNIFSVDEAEKLGESPEFLPISVRPDDAYLLFSLGVDDNAQLMLVDFDAEEAKTSELLDLGSEEDESGTFYGWAK